MKIILVGEDAIRLEPGAGPLTIEAPTAEEQYNPFHMLASGLATCTFAVLHSWASHVGLAAEDLVIEVRWMFAEHPHRLGAIDLEFTWPSLPEARRAVAKRVAALCPIHATLSHPPTLTIQAVS